ncbi:hypothetical protein ACQ4PT_071197 [Festuca glaucescens]
MAPKALPGLLLLALVCGELVIAGHGQTYIGGTRGMQPLPYAKGRSPAGMEPPAYTRPTPVDDATGRVPGVAEEKAFMIHGLPPHDRARPVPVPPTAN